MFAALALAAAIGAAPPPSPAEAAITVVEGRILARDIARESPDGSAVVASLPRGMHRIELTEERRRALLRNRFPGGRYALLHRGTLAIEREAGTDQAAAPGTCFAARADIAAGSAIVRNALEQVSCSRDAAGAWLTHDARSRTLFARADIPAGTYLGRIRPGAAAGVAAGARLVFRSSEGPVTIEREATALQPARAGRPLFARTEDGEVLRSKLAEETDR